MGKFFVTKNSTWKYYFIFESDNGKKLLQSEYFNTKSEILKAINYLQNESNQSKNLKTYIEANWYYFSITWDDGKVLANSFLYSWNRSEEYDDFNYIFKAMSKSEIVTVTQEKLLNIQESKIRQNEDTLKKVSEKQSKDMLDIFKELKQDFSHEERLWLAFGFYIFLILFVIASALISLLSPIISAYANIVLIAVIFLIIWSLSSDMKDDQKIEPSAIFIATLILISTFFPVIYFFHEAYIAIFWWTSSWVRIINWEMWLNQLENIVPLTLVLFSVLWFSVHQYWRAKKLRIEQQNKQAMIHYMQAVIAQDWKGDKDSALMSQLAPFFANTIIHRPFSQDNYDPQLPIDEVKKVVDMAKLFQK